MTRQQARSLERALSKEWVATRMRGPKQERKGLISQIAKSSWKALQRHENPPSEQRG